MRTDFAKRTFFIRFSWGFFLEGNEVERLRSILADCPNKTPRQMGRRRQTHAAAHFISSSQTDTEVSTLLLEVVDVLGGSATEADWGKWIRSDPQLSRRYVCTNTAAEVTLRQAQTPIKASSLLWQPSRVFFFFKCINQSNCCLIIRDCGMKRRAVMRNALSTHRRLFISQPEYYTITTGVYGRVKQDGSFSVTPNISTSVVHQCGNRSMPGNGTVW